MISKEKLAQIKIRWIKTEGMTPEQFLTRLRPADIDHMISTIEKLQKDVEVYKVALKAAGIPQVIIDLIGESNDPT